MTWQEEQVNERQTVSRLTLAVSRVMGWNFLPTENGDYIEKDGKQISLGLVWNQKDRVVIRGSIHQYRDHLPYKYDNPEITVAIARGAEVIAKEITRRVLPGYEVLLTQLRNRKAAHDEHTRIVQDNLAALMAVLANVPGLRQSGDSAKFWVRHCDVEVFRDSANLKLDLPIDVAMQVLELIRPLASKEA